MWQLLAHNTATGRKRLIFTDPLDYVTLYRHLRCPVLRRHICRPGEVLVWAPSTRRLRWACAIKKEAYLAEKRAALEQLVDDHQPPPVSAKKGFVKSMIDKLLRKKA